jgi:hypothetical protein
MSLVAHPISQSSLDISSIWTPIIAVEVRKLQLQQLYITWESCVFMLILHRICLFSDCFYFDNTLILKTGR